MESDTILAFIGPFQPYIPPFPYVLLLLITNEAAARGHGRLLRCTEKTTVVV